MPASAMISRPEALMERLQAASVGTGGESLLKILRDVKNQIIGNKTKKLLYLHLGAVQRIVAVLTSSLDADGDSSCTDLIVQCAAALGSFCCGVDDGVQAVIDAGAVPRLIRLLSCTDEKVVDAGARSLRIIFQSKLAPKFDLLLDDNLKFLLLLLNNKNENVTDLAASIIKHSCKSREEQKVLCDAGVLRRLFSLLEGSLCQRDSSLDSIAAIVKGNSEAVSHLTSINDGRSLNFIIELMKDRYPRTRLLSCVCLIAIGNSSSYHFLEREIESKLILILMELLEDQGQVGDEAAFSLVTLISDKQNLHKQAISMNIVEKLCNFLRQGDLSGKRLQGILLVLAELCSRWEKSRDHCISSSVLSVVSDCLRHECADVRTAACKCISSISRSVKILFAGHLANEMIVLGLAQLLSDSSDFVLAASLKALCNVVVNLKVNKNIFIQSGCVKKLVVLSKSTNTVFRLNATWALRNLMFHVDKTCREHVLSELSETALAGLISDLEPRVQEHALGLIRNLVDSCVNSIQSIFGTDNVILDAVAGQMQQMSLPEVCVQGMFVLTNIAAGNEFQKEAVMNRLLLPKKESTPFFLKFLRSSNDLLRTASVWCIVNLTCPDGPNSSSRASRLRDAGIISQLKSMVNDPCLDVKFRVRTALGHCTIVELSSF